MDWKHRYVPPARCLRASSSRALAREVRDRLHAVRSRPDAWNAVWHPLGFMDIELFSDETESVRLHIWSALRGAYRSSGFAIHKHDWSMSSYVICGEVENRIFDVSNDGSPTHRVYRIEYRGRANRLRATGEQVRCALRRAERIGPGTTYTLAPGVFHDVSTDGCQTTATLVRGIRHPGLENEVLGEIDAAEQYETERTRCDVLSVRTAIDLILARCFDLE